MRSSHILVETLEQATELRQQIADGADFESFVLEYSICTSKFVGEDLSPRSPGDLGEAVLEDVPDDLYNGDSKRYVTRVSQLEVGEISEPFQTQFGYHLILRTE